jgi:hypothetical protein
MFSVVYEIRWKNIIGRAGNRWQYGACPLHAGYLRLQMHTLRLCNNHCFSTATMISRTRLGDTLYYITCRVNILPSMATMFRPQNLRLSHFWILASTATDITSNSCINLRFQSGITNNYLHYRTFGLGDFQQIGNTGVFRAKAQKLRFQA